MWSLDQVALEVSADPDVLHHHVKKLSTDFYPRNLNAPENVIASAQYIKGRLKETTSTVYEQSYLTGDDKHVNVIAEYGPASQEVIVVGAHYDAYFETPGADDNASGVAGLLELGRLFSSTKMPIKVILVAYDTEEPPYFGSEDMGSYHHAKLLKDSDMSVRLMISLEMIGYFSPEKDSQSYPHPLFQLVYPSSGDYISIIDQFFSNDARELKSAMRQVMSLGVYSSNVPKMFPGADYSDHRNYWSHGYNAVMITNTAFHRNTEYHTEEDTHDRLDYESMAQVVNGVYWSIMELGAR